jgi:hypothetical protein
VVVLYVCIFGLSDYIVNKWIKTDISYIIYYLTVGIIGFGLLYYKTQNSKLFKKKDLKNLYSKAISNIKRYSKLKTQNIISAYIFKGSIYFL